VCVGVMKEGRWDQVAGPRPEVAVRRVVCRENKEQRAVIVVSLGVRKKRVEWKPLLSKGQRGEKEKHT